MLSMVACTQGDIPTEPSTEPSTEPVAVAPERGQPDKSNLLYMDAIESCKKTDGPCSDRAYVTIQ